MASWISVFGLVCWTSECVTLVFVNLVDATCDFGVFGCGCFGFVVVGTVALGIFTFMVLSF